MANQCSGTVRQATGLELLTVTKELYGQPVLILLRCAVQLHLLISARKAFLASAEQLVISLITMNVGLFEGGDVDEVETCNVSFSFEFLGKVNAENHGLCPLLLQLRVSVHNQVLEEKFQ